MLFRRVDWFVAFLSLHGRMANAVWYEMNGAGKDLPDQPASCSMWKEWLPLLKDVSFWRKDAISMEKADKRRKDQRDKVDCVEEEPEGSYGYDFIQVAIRRDPLTLTYSEESGQIVAAREKYGQQLLDVVRSRACLEFLRELRDEPAGHWVQTERSKAWKKHDNWKLITLACKSPTGPLVVDNQVFALYRLMRRVRRVMDRDNVQ